MSFWNNMGFNNCPPGQRYSELLKMCVAEDAAGNIVTTPSGEVMVNEDTAAGQGQFWDRAPDYIDSLANLWSAIKGRPVQGNAPAGSSGYYPPPPDRGGNEALLMVGGLILLLLIVLLFIRRKS